MAGNGGNAELWTAWTDGMIEVTRRMDLSFGGPSVATGYPVGEARRGLALPD